MRAAKSCWFVLGGACLLAFLSAAVWIRDEARRRLAGNGRELPVNLSLLKNPHALRGANRNQVLAEHGEHRSIVRFQDSYFAATDGGMVQFSTDGQVLRHYTVLDGLTESDLLSFAVFDSKLFIGTASHGLLSFDGERFASYRWPDREPQAVTAMLADGGRLLVGS